MTSTPTGTSSAIQTSDRLPWWRRALLTVAAVVVALAGTPAGQALAEPGPGYNLNPVYWGVTDLGQLIIDYRIRHPSVSGSRNVAVFELRRPDGTIEHYAAASVGTVPADQAIGWVDKWVNGKFAGTILMRNMGNKHSEQIVEATLGKDAALVIRGESELKPCQQPSNNCRANLQRTWFNQIREMNYNFDYYDILGSYLATNSKLKASTNNKAGVKALQDQIDWWVKMGRPRTPPFGSTVFAPPGSAPTNGNFVNTLAGIPGAQNGGIDFSALELRYLADAPPGGQQGIRFAFSAPPSSQPPRLDLGQAVTLQASDAFFVWLSLTPSTFWVNLNPDEPDRIVDAKLGTTDVGRVMLEADLQMKKTVAKLIHPDTAIGKQFWAGLDSGGTDNTCLSFRQWIVPAPATVREDQGSLYILDAPLSVMLESDYVAKGATAYTCPGQSEATKKHNEQLFRSLILPKIQEAVNHAPEYADLRRIYLSRVAAEWYRKRAANQHTMFTDLINQGDVKAWPARQKWTPKEVFDRYVKSYTDGEFKVTHQTQQGNIIYTHTYIYGGVDFGAVPYFGLGDAAFNSKYGGLPGTVTQSLQKPTADHNGAVWFGSSTEPRPIAAPADSSNADQLNAALTTIKFGLLLCLALIVVVVVVAVLIAVRVSRRRRTPVGAGPVYTRGLRPPTPPGPPR